MSWWIIAIAVLLIVYLTYRSWSDDLEEGLTTTHYTKQEKYWNGYYALYHDYVTSPDPSKLTALQSYFKKADVPSVVPLLEEVLTVVDHIKEVKDQEEQAKMLLHWTAINKKISEESEEDLGDRAEVQRVLNAQAMHLVKKIQETKEKVVERK